MTTPTTPPPASRTGPPSPAGATGPVDHASSGAGHPEPRRRKSAITIAALVAAVVVAGAAAAWIWTARAKHRAGASESAQGSGAGAGAASSAAAGGAADRAIPVLTTAVAARDVPVFLEGIGSVVPLKTVMVKPQVDGRLDRVAFEEGQPVRKGDLLAQIDPRPYAILREQAEAALARDRAQLGSSRLTLERYETVRKQNLIAQQQVDDQRASVRQLEATIQADQAQLDNANLQLDYARIRSPIDGVTGVRLVDPGNIIRASDPTGIVLLTQIDPIAVLFSLPQDDLPRVAARMAEATLQVDILGRDGQATLGTGTLALIDNQINQTTATIRLKVILPNPKRMLWPNQFVKARLLLTTLRGALVLPAAAVQRGPQGTFVYVVGADQKAAVRPVKIASVEGDTAVVSTGLAAGDSVVTEGVAQLRPGARVTTRTQERAEGPSGRRPRSPANGSAPGAAGGAGAGDSRGPGVRGPTGAPP